MNCCYSPLALWNPTNHIGLVQNQDNVYEWRDMSTNELLLQSANIIKSY